LAVFEEKFRRLTLKFVVCMLLVNREVLIFSVTAIGYPLIVAILE